MSGWHARWRENRIGFHQDETNRHLLALIDRFPDRGRVFVPLCGKSRDMTFLAERGYDVVGVELVEEATVAYFEERPIPCERDGRELVGGGVRIICDDIFAVSPDDVGEVAWIFDRAALVALPPDARRRYADHLLSFLPAGRRILLVALHYDERKMNGPPFSVPPKEVERLFAGCDRELITRGDILDRLPRFRERGLDWLEEHVWILTVLPPARRGSSASPPA